MTRVAFATSAEYASLTDDDQCFADALQARDVSVDPAVWSDDGVDWRRYDAVVVRSCWDYHENVVEFGRWVDALDAADVVLFNSPAALHWNRHKFYLRDLEARGIETVPTEYVARADSRPLEAILDDRDWDDAVVKPAVSAGAEDTWRTDRSRADSHQKRYAELRDHADLLVQQYAHEVEDGEWSLMFAGGEYTHSVLKRPEGGDFRVQEHFGGTYAAAEPDDELVEQAASVVEAATDELGEESLYARVDGVDADGTLVLIELELIEPSLFYDAVPDSASEMADALVARLD
ncbi:ATP-grasp domain-containing protein [Haloarchaeobius sp. DFWS5]|uniref:ATP-grasp domain-containing protein n=1 Tax=Haloarchaeobius sp. DFWS5 TaxID=3446114 RepID=UPI003EBD1ECF